MEEIIQKASELGRMIQQTDVYTAFSELSEQLGEDSQAAQLLEEYVLLAENIHSRELNGDIVESFEKDRLDELKNSVENNDLLVEYLQTKNSYIKLLELIQSSINAEDE